MEDLLDLARLEAGQAHFKLAELSPAEAGQNALDQFYGQDGRVTLSASQGDGFVRFAVMDTGPGLEPQHLEKVWQRFYIVGKASTSDEGAGLGLAITRELVVAMGGEVGVESTPGQGATFWCTLPVAG